MEIITQIRNVPAAIGQLVFDKLRELTPVNIDELNAIIIEQGETHEQI